ncbi:hypothetical protein YC2023_075942 [Brassica napus]
MVYMTIDSRDGERDEVTTPGMLLKRNIRDDEMNQRVGGDDKEDYDRSGPSTKLEKTRSVCSKSFVHINIVFPVTTAQLLYLYHLFPIKSRIMDFQIFF